MSTATVGLTDFFARHFPDLGTDERIEIRAFPQGDGPVRRSWHATPLAAAQTALRLPQHLNIFFGIQARRDGGGKKADVTKVRALWADLDFKGYTDGREGAFRALEAFPLRPTVVVESGNGFHLYWYLAAAIAPSAAIEQLLGRLYQRLGADKSVLDLSRVLRVPETFNNKTTPAKLARVYHAEYEAVYTLADFDALLPAPVEPERVAWTPPTTGGVRSAYDDVPSIAEMRAILRFIPPGGEYTADWLRHLAAVHSVYPGRDGEAMCAEWCDGKPGEIARKFASFKRDGRASDAASVGTLIHIAKQHGYEPPRRAQASPKFIMPQDESVADSDVQDVLEMAQALDTAQRRIAELELKLSQCREEHARKDVLIEAQATEIQARKAAAAHTDQTIGGAIFDIAGEIVAARKRGAVLNEGGKQLVRVEYKRAASQGMRSAQTNSKAVHKINDSGHVPVIFRAVRIETEKFAGEVEAAYIEIPEEHCETQAKAALYLLPPPPPKKHGGARRKVELPEFDEPVAGPVRCVTEKRKLWSDLTTDKVVKVERIGSHTEHFDADGYQMTAAEVDEFKVGIGMQVRTPAYRPTVQLALSPDDIEAATGPRYDPADFGDSRRPVPLHGECAWQGCTLPAGKDDPLCARHRATAAFSMTGAD